MDAAALAKGAKGLAGFGTAVWKYIMRRPIVPRRTLRLVPDERETWWHLGATSGEPAMQIAARWYATNITRAPIYIVRVRLLRPSALGQVLVQHPKQSVYGSFPLLPGAMTRISTDFWIQPPCVSEGKPFSARVEFTDNLGNRHKTKRVTFAARIRAKSTSTDPPQEAVYAIADPVVKNLVALLKAEAEHYRIFGRPSGGLGSVQTIFSGKTLKALGSDWREVDSPLQQEIAIAPEVGAIRSEHADTLLALWHSLNTPEESEAFVRGLLDRFSRGTEYSPVAYLIGLVLFRLGRFQDAIRKARSDLTGDGAYGFSDFLRLTDGLLRFEHPAFSDELLDEIERSLDGLSEHQFRIPQRIAAIRAYRLSPNRRQPPG